MLPIQDLDLDKEEVLNTGKYESNWKLFLIEYLLQSFLLIYFYSFGMIAWVNAGCQFYEVLYGE